MEPVLGFAIRDGVAEGEAMDAFRDKVSDKALVCYVRGVSLHARPAEKQSKRPFCHSCAIRECQASSL